MSDWLTIHRGSAPLVVAMPHTGTDLPADIARRALKRGFIVNAPRPDVLRLAPPLVITTDDLQPFVDALPELVA